MNKLFTILFSTLPKEHYCKSMFLVVFSSTTLLLIYFFSYYATPRTFPDTPGYYDFHIYQPWKSVRTPLVGAFFTMLGVDARTVSHGNDKQHKEREYNKICIAQNILYSFSISILIFYLCKIIPIIYVIFAFFCCTVASPPPPNAILADQILFVLCVLFISVCIRFFTNHRLVDLLVLCAIAIFACLTKPVGIFLSAIALTIIVYNIFFNACIKILQNILIITFLVIGTFIWPIWLYANSGIFVMSQLSYIHNAIHLIHHIQPGDENFFTDKKEHALALRLIIDKMRILADSKEKTKFKTYLRYRNEYMWPTVGIALRDIYGKKLTAREQAVLFKKMSQPILKKYKIDRIKHIFNSIIYGFTSGDSHISYFFLIKCKNNFLSKYWSIISFLLIISSSILFIYTHIENNVEQNRLRSIIDIILTSSLMHILNIVATSCGHIVFRRYIEITECFFVLSALLSLYVISYIIYMRHKIS